MASWSEIEAAEPAFAARVRELFDAEKHKTIATVRADGGPRISGIEVEFADGELTFGSMPHARKGADLRRDPRFALHSASVAPPEGEEARWAGDAKVAGLAVPAGPIEGEGAAASSTAPICARWCSPASTPRPRPCGSSGGRRSGGLRSVERE
jgi:hypothetical protein